MHTRLHTVCFLVLLSVCSVFAQRAPESIPILQANKTINVEFYGAFGDSVKRTVLLQAALDDAMKKIAGEGRNTEVYFPRGLYLADTLVLKANSVYAGNAGYIHLRGAGKQNTVLRVKHIQFGGPSTTELITFLQVSDMTIDTLAGTPANNTLVSLRRVDRSSFRNVVFQNSKGVGVKILASTVNFDNCEFNTSTLDGLIYDASNSSSFTNCFFNNNIGYGIRIQYTGGGKGTAPDTITGSASILSSSRMQIQIGSNNHFEGNQAGIIYVNGSDNVTIDGNAFSSYGSATKMIEFAAISRNGKVVNNFYQAEGWDLPTKVAGSASDYAVLKFGPQTYNNVYSTNSQYHLGVDVSTFDFKSQVIDSGRNYSLEYENAHFRQFAAVGGSPYLGWGDLVRKAAATPIKRANHLLWSENFTKAEWILAGPGDQTITRALGVRSPFAREDSTNQLSTGTNNESITTLTQTISGLTILPGEMITFSAFMRIPYNPPVVVDWRLRILDSANIVLAEIGYRPKDFWGRYGITFLATDTISTLKCQLYNRTRQGATTLYVDGAQLSEGDMAPYIKTESASVSVEPGLVANAGRFNRALNVVGKLTTSYPSFDSLYIPNWINLGEQSWRTEVIAKGAARLGLWGSWEGSSLILGDSTPVAADKGSGGLVFIGLKTNSPAAFASFGKIRALKENATLGDGHSYLKFETAAGEMYRMDDYGRLTSKSPFTYVAADSQALATKKYVDAQVGSPVAMTKQNIIDTLNSASVSIAGLTRQYRFSHTSNDFFADTIKGTTVLGAPQNISLEAPQDLAFGVTKYVGFGTNVTDENDALFLFSTPGTISHLYINCYANTLNGNSVITVRKNSAGTTLTLTLTGGASAGNNTGDSFTVAAGDLISVEIANAGSSGNLSKPKIAFRFTPN